MSEKTPRGAQRHTLTETLRGFSDDQLARLFAARPDLVTPLPSDMAQVATRAAAPSSLARVLDRLDRLQLAIVEALVVSATMRHAGAGTQLAGTCSVEGLGRMLGLTHDRQRELAEAVERLRDLAVVWGPPDDLITPAALPELLGPHPAGLGPVSDDAALAEPASIERLLEEAGPDAREAAKRLAGDSPIGLVAQVRRDVTVATARSPIERLLARGLLIPRDDRTVVLPRQVGLHLRGGRLYDVGVLTAPSLTGPSRDRTLVDRTAAGTTLEVIRRVEQLLERWASEPPAVLRAGGLGVRDLRRTAVALDIDEAGAALHIEVAYAAGLLAPSDGEWLPTSAYDTWLVREPAERWAQLAVAWLTSPRVAQLVGTRDERDRPRTALSAEIVRVSAPEIRRLVLDILDVAGDHEQQVLAPDRACVVEMMRWRRPRRMTRFVRELIDATLDEAAALGVTGLGALASHGAALSREGLTPGEHQDADADDGTEKAIESAVVSALRPSLPEPVHHVLLQGDLTAIAPGPLPVELARELASMADPESQGAATVYRFSAASIRRALDAGRTAAELHDTLAKYAATSVPQPLTYLIDDVARKHGQLRAGAATAYLRCDDPTLLDAVLADRRAAGLGLRRLAPTVAIAKQPVRTIVDTLRELGYPPVPETADGALLVAPSRGRRATDSTESQMGRWRGVVADIDPGLVAAAVRAVRAGDRARANRPPGVEIARLRNSQSAQAIDVLRAALADSSSVWVGYVDLQGGARERIVDPVRIDGGWLTAYDHAAGEVRTFALHRITGAAPVKQ
jgi:hypothetical protein